MLARVGTNIRFRTDQQTSGETIGAGKGCIPRSKTNVEVNQARFGCCE